MKAKAPIVLLHGWGFTPAVWTPLINALLQRQLDRQHLLTPALPLATGQSTAQIIDALSARLPERAHVVGWSLGGELALALALSMPQRITSMTLIASTPCFMNRKNWTLGQPESLLDDFDQRLAANPTALLKRFSMLMRHGDSAASRDRALADSLSEMSDSDTNRLAAGLQLLRHIDLREAATDSAVPSLLIHGSDDSVVPIAAAEWLQQQGLPNLHRIDGASHALPLTHAETIASQLIDFIGQHA